MARAYFLRWLIQETGLVALAALLIGTGFLTGVHGPPAYALALIGVVAVCVTALAGRLAWRADTALGRGETVGNGYTTLPKIQHDAEHVFYSVAVFQILALIGAALGYRELASVHAAGQAGIDAINIGLANGLTPTVAGMIVSLAAGLQHHLLAHRLASPDA